MSDLTKYEIFNDLEKLTLELKDRRRKLPAELSMIDKEIADIEHYIEFYPLSASKGYKVAKMLKDCLSKSLVLMTQIAKDYGMSAKALNKILKNMGVQYKVNDQWVLYSKYQGKGYVHSRTIDITRTDGSPDVKMQTKWTQKGRLFLCELLKEERSGSGDRKGL